MSRSEAQSTMLDTLLGKGIPEKVALKLDNIRQEGILSGGELFDDRALDGLKEFTEADALLILEQFTKSDLSHAQNKSAFLCGVMKTHRAKMKTTKEAGEVVPADEVTEPGEPLNVKKGPNEETLKELLDRTGYTLDITNGQRKYGGPPPNWEGPMPGRGETKFCSQIYIGKLPSDMYEDELVPLFEPHGVIYDLRIMVDQSSGLNKGFAFCTYTTKEEAQAAVKNMDKKEVRDNVKLGVCLSQPNNRLFVGAIPRTATKKTIMEEFSSRVDHLIDVIIYTSSVDKTLNRGFAFLEFESHKDAAIARRRLMSGKIQVFGHKTPSVDWADPIHEPDEEVMSKVKVVYVRNLSPAVDDTKLKELFDKFGVIESVKKVKNYAFIHFQERDDALRAIQEINGQEVDDLKLEVSLAKPPVDKKENRRGMSGFGALNHGRGRSHEVRFRGRGGRGGFRGGFGGYQHGFGDGYGYPPPHGYPPHGFGYYGPPGGRGGAPPRGMLRGHPMGPPRGGGPTRGAPGGSYGPPPMRGGGFRGFRGGQRGNRGYGRGEADGNQRKRKSDFQTEDDGGKRKFGDGSWGTQPIAQQPLSSTNSYYSDDYGTAAGHEWYSNSYEGGGETSWN